MRWMLILLGVLILAAVAVFLLGRGGKDPLDAEGLGARDRAADERVPLRAEGASDEDATGADADGSEGESVAGPGVDGAVSSGVATEPVPGLASDGEREGRASSDGPTLAGAEGASESRTRATDDETPAGETTKGPRVHVRVVREGSAEPLPGALVFLVDAGGQRHEQRADGEGVARFVCLPPGDGEADAVIGGWVSRWLLPVQVPTSGTLEGDLRMQAAVSLHGTVRAAEDETPVAGARVTAIAGGALHENRGRSSSSRGVYATVVTDAMGAFRFRSLPRDDVCTLAVQASGYRYADLGVMPKADADLPVEILLEKGGRLQGRVTDPAGLPVVGAEVFVFLESQPHLARNPRQGRLGRDPERVSLPGMSGDDGQYEVVGLTFGESYAATAYAKGYLRAANANGIVVTEAAPVVTMDFGVRSAARIQIRVLDLEGQPVTSGQLVGHLRGRFTRRVAVGADGTARLEGVPPGQLRIRALCEGFRPGKTTVEVGSGDAIDVELKLEPLPPGVEVSGIAVDEGGNPIPDLTIVGMARGTRQSVRTTTDSAGRFVLPNLQAGRVTIRVHQLGFKPSSLETEAPAADVRLVVTRFTMVRGHVELAPGMAKPDIIHVTTEPLDAGVGGGGSSSPFGDGSFEAFVKPDIELRVRICADTFAPWTRDVRVPEGETLDLGTIPVNAGIAVAGVVLDPEGRPAAGVVLEVRLDFVVQRTATTDADGRFRLEHLPVGTHSVKLLVEGHAEQTRDVEATTSLQDVRLVLTRAE